MVFSSLVFLFVFLPLTLVLYFIVPRNCRNFILLIVSLIFYAWGEPIYILLMLFSTVVDFIHGLLVEYYADQPKKAKRVVLSSVFINLGLLMFFKYSGFIISNINQLLGAQFNIPSIALPIGISFYTFQTMSYTIDIFRKDAPAQRNIISLGAYVTMFPQLIAGPIVRYETIEDELSNRKHSFENFAYGTRRFVIGLAKKVLIANMLGEFCNKFSATDEKSVVLYWLFAISYMLQIYFDFSAYSDMAIGLGRIFGFHFLENFNYPYISKSITEFWRRWHISLGSWFRDYVYIPLGGSRKGKLILVRNLIIVWLLTGIWHGASWNFVIWGLMFGLLLIIEKLWLGKYIEKLPNIFKKLYVLFIVMISFIIFNAGTMKEAFANIAGLFGANSTCIINDYTIYYLRSYLITIIIAIIGATPILKNIIEKLKTRPVMNKIINILEPITMVVVLLIVTAYLVDNSYNPFLYFRF